MQVKDNKIIILSIDGGGIRGILPGMILAGIEKALSECDPEGDGSISRHFDFVAGTSTGGILGFALLLPDDNGKPKYSALDAVNIYLDRGDEIFDVPLWKKAVSLNALRDEKYPAQELEEQASGSNTKKANAIKNINNGVEVLVGIISKLL